MKLGHDDEQIGHRESPSAELIDCVIERPGTMTDRAWNTLASRFCEVMNAGEEKRQKLDSANMALYSGFWRFGPPNVPRLHMTLQQYIDAVTEFHDEKMKPKRYDAQRKGKPRLDLALILKDIAEIMTKRDLTWRDVARQAEVNASTLSKMKNGQTPDITNMVMLHRWINMHRPPAQQRKLEYYLVEEVVS